MGGVKADGRPVPSMVFTSPCAGVLEGIGISPDVSATSRAASLSIVVQGVRVVWVALDIVSSLGFGPGAYVQKEVRPTFLRKEVMVLVVPRSEGARG